MIIDPINDIENSDCSEVECCRHCRELIEPGTEVPYNGWWWHNCCVPCLPLCDSCGQGKVVCDGC